jgi:hypothetical protein
MPVLLSKKYSLTYVWWTRILSVTGFRKLVVIIDQNEVLET